MPHVYYAPLGAPVQIDGFPEDSPHAEGLKMPFKRSQKDGGALHLRPGSTFDLTADELAHIRTKHPDVARHLRETGLTDEEREDLKDKGGPPPDALGETEASRVPKPHDNESVSPALPGPPPTELERAKEGSELQDPKLQTAGDGGQAASTPGPRSGHAPPPKHK
jgi:hypothetical protein